MPALYKFVLVVKKKEKKSACLQSVPRSGFCVFVLFGQDKIKISVDVTIIVYAVLDLDLVLLFTRSLHELSHGSFPSGRFGMIRHSSSWSL